MAKHNDEFLFVLDRFQIDAGQIARESWSNGAKEQALILKPIQIKILKFRNLNFKSASKYPSVPIFFENYTDL